MTRFATLVLGRPAVACAGVLVIGAMISSALLRQHLAHPPSSDSVDRGPSTRALVRTVLETRPSPSAAGNAADIPCDPFNSPLFARPAPEPVAVTRVEPVAAPAPTLDEFQAEASRKLALRSVITGADNRALVNGILYREGDVVDGYHLIHIDRRRIVVEREGLTATISMPHP